MYNIHVLKKWQRHGSLSSLCLWDDIEVSRGIEKIPTFDPIKTWERSIVSLSVVAAALEHAPHNSPTAAAAFERASHHLPYPRTCPAAAPALERAPTAAPPANAPSPSPPPLNVP